MILFLLRVLVTFFIIFCGYWVVIAILWEEDIVSDEWHTKVNEVGKIVMASALGLGIIAIGLMLIWCLWKGA